MIDLFTDLQQQLNKLSIRKMQFQVNHIIFDFDEELTHDEKIDILDDNIGFWEANDEDDLIDEITTASGWCIKSIDYHHILN